MSGGGDSIALMRLVALWGASRGVRVEVASVDHRLRPGSAAEAADAAQRAAALGLAAQVLRWDGWDGSGNLQARARDARRRLLGGWAAARGLAAVATGHTLDDQAETLVMRLARGSGVDGLAAMAGSVERDGALWLRPLLGLRRDALRDWLRGLGETWTEDPSNDDSRFARVRARRAIAALGLDPARLGATAARMARARAALEAATAALWAVAARVGGCGEVVLDCAPLRSVPREIALRVLGDALRYCAGAERRPGMEHLDALLDVLLAGPPASARTLHGCVILPSREGVTLAREPAAMRGDAAGAPDLWDGRWRVATSADGAVGPLGEQGAAALAAARRAGLWRPAAAWRAAPRAARLTTPCLWREGVLGCAPVAGYGEGLAATLATPPAPCGRVETTEASLM